jgi:hypothetical protein
MTDFTKDDAMFLVQATGLIAGGSLLFFALIVLLAR